MIRITVKFGEILDWGRWDEFCTMSGTNQVRLTLEEARKIGLLPSDEA